MSGLFPAAPAPLVVGAVFGLGMWFGFETVVAPAVGLGRHQQRRSVERLLLAASCLPAATDACLPLVEFRRGVITAARRGRS